PESGLYHFHFRQYDPSAGVWTSEDPIGIIGGNNLYSYVRNNPVNRVDSLGLFEDSGFDDMGDVDDFGEQVDRADYSHPGTELGARERDVDDFGERQDRKDYVDPDSILANRNSTFDDLFRCILPALGKISIKVGKLTYYTIQAITGAFLSRNPLSGVEALAEWEITVQELTEISKNTRDCCQKK
ncbi:RHS repeat-associated core domain-containing protein, partial [Desulforhopalus singaporensis]